MIFFAELKLSTFLISSDQECPLCRDYLLKTVEIIHRVEINVEINFFFLSQDF
jgi:hypothetical protein